jgi:NAD(P)-dependent dehydrogenase (short-subunit alcohol dehydrogenase family)
VTKKAAIVTGAARGIGYAVAKELLSQGIGVVIGDKDKTRCESALDSLAQFGNVRALVMDVVSEEEVIKLVHLCEETFGGLDLLVNNAAIVNLAQPHIINMSLEEWNQRLAVNLTSYFLCTKHALPLLKKRRGSIVNISSTRALMSEPNTETYSVAKGGIEALTHALAITYGPDVRVNAIRPGWIDTRDDRDQKLLPNIAHSQHPVGRVGRPEDIASLVVYLATAGFITGQSFTVDGGLTRKMIYEE